MSGVPWEANLLSLQTMAISPAVIFSSMMMIKNAIEVDY